MGALERLAALVGVLRSLLFTIPLIYIYTLMMGFISLLVSPFDREARRQQGVARLWAQIILWTSFIRLRVRGRENLEPGRAYVFIANHQSYMDTPLVFVALPPGFRIMAKARLFGIPFLGWHLRRTGNIPIPYGKPFAAAHRLLQAVAVIRQGRSLMVFPEGGRSPDATVGEFKTGIFVAAIQAGSPIVPMTIRDSYKVLGSHSWRIRSGTVEIHFHAPLSTAGLTRVDADELGARVRGRIIEALGPPAATRAGK